MNLAVHFIRKKSNLIPSYFSEPFLFILVGVVGGKENCGGEGEVGEIIQFSITERMIFYILFML